MPIISNWFQKLPQNIPYGMFRFQFIPWYGESLYKFEQVATGAPTENIYISAGSTPTTFHLIIVFYVGSQEYSSSWLNLVLSSWRKLNWRIRPARRLCAGFRKFSKKIHASRARGAAARVWQFTLPGSRSRTLRLLELSQIIENQNSDFVSK